MAARCLAALAPAAHNGLVVQHCSAHAMILLVFPALGALVVRVL